MKNSQLTLTALILAGAVGAAYCQDQGGGGQTVTIPKEQYQKLMEEHQKLLEEVKEIKAWKAQMEQNVNQAAKQKETDQTFDDMEKEIGDVKKMAKDSFPGTTKLLMAGYGSAGFTSGVNGPNRGFTATFNPIFLWKLSDRLLFEGELEAELEGTDTHLALEMAQISYVLNDYMTVGGGKFLNPMNYFVERQHMAWVNKLPDKPLAVYDGLLPEANEGIQLRGGIPIGPTKLGYSVFAVNAPALQVDPATVPANGLGAFEFDNFDNVGRHIAYGGRIGFLPVPELELGYGLEYAAVTPPGSPDHVSALLQSVDLSYVRDSAALKGTVNLKAQWVWSHVGNYVYDPASVVGGPFVFNNSRNGGYAQFAYRPSMVENSILRNIEPVFRFDMLNQQKTSAGFDEWRYTVGLNYWLAPSSVLKAAYVFDHERGLNADPHDLIELQFATGF